MCKREINVAEQQDVRGHPRMAGFEGVRPSLALHSPRWENFSRLADFVSWFLGRRTHRIQVLLKPHHTPEHRRRRRERSSRDTDGSDKSPISTMVTSWKPLSRTRGSGIKAHALRSSLSCRTRTTAASGRRPVRPRTSGTVSKSTTPSEWRSRTASGAFQGTSSVTSNVMPGRPPTLHHYMSPLHNPH